MAGSLNCVQLIGNLGKDPEIRALNSGDRVATFSMAMSETWKSNGERKERTEWVTVVVFNDALVDVIEKYTKKGSKVYVQGALQTRKWEKDGVTRYTTEVVLQKFGAKLLLLGDAGGGSSSDERYAGQRNDYGGTGGGGQGGGSAGSRESFAADLDDEIPF